MGMKALIQKLLVIVILLFTFSSFVFLRNLENTKKTEVKAASSYDYDYTNGIEDREIFN
jgi:hypothetical protein